MQPIDMNQFRTGVKGKPYKALIQHHLKKQNDNDRNLGILGTIEMIPLEIHQALEDYIDRWNLRGYDKHFWITDCADVFDEMIQDARAVLQYSGMPEEDEILFNFFQVVTLNFASMASEQPKLRKFAGIKKGLFF